MRLSFLDRTDELSRLNSLVALREGSLGVLYGRRRCGKSRLLQEVLPKHTVSYLADDREGLLQRSSLATEMSRRIPGFDRVDYPDWEALFSRWWDEAPPGSVLAMDEFPTLVSVAKEVPSVLQKFIDRRADAGIHVVLAGSSQRMMQGLILDRSAPLYGRAAEILRILPLPAGWIGKALKIRDPARAVEAFSVWGGIPRYWELAADVGDLREGIRKHVLSPLGVLREEPARLLLDDHRDTTQAASILGLIGRGCHRMSEIAGRLGKPATSLTRPLRRLVDLGLVIRSVPFGASERDSKRSLYRIGDPFLAFWFRFVEPNRSLIESGKADRVAADVAKKLSAHVGEIWEDLARASVPHLRLFGRDWGPAGRWWGAGVDRRPLEVDIVAEAEGGDALLVGEVKWSEGGRAERLLEDLGRRAERLPFRRGMHVHCALWLGRGPASAARRRDVVGPTQVMEVLR